MAANPEGIKALVAKWREMAANPITFGLSKRHAACLIRRADELESLTAVAEGSRAITALKVTLFETECYLPASIAKRVQAACAVAVAGDAEPSNLGEFVIALLIAGGYVTQAKVDEARKIALSCGPYEMPASQAGDAEVVARELLAQEVAAMPRTYEACDYQDEYKAAALRAIRRALNTRQAFETMPAPAPDCDTRHAVTFYFNDKAAAEQFRTRQAVEGMVLVRKEWLDVLRDKAAEVRANGHKFGLRSLHEAADTLIEVRRLAMEAAAPQAGKGDK